MLSSGDFLTSDNKLAQLKFSHWDGKLPIEELMVVCSSEYRRSRYRC